MCVGGGGGGGGGGGRHVFACGFGTINESMKLTFACLVGVWIQES